jgi:DnaJ domain
MATHYDTLQVVPTASDDVLHDSYRRLARRYHPDAPGGDEQRMARLNEAWRVLNDPARRARYDAELRGASGESSAAGFHSQRRVDDDIDDARGFVPSPRFTTPRRWPAMSLMLIAAMATIFVFTAYATTVHNDPAPPITSPRLLGSDMCVVLIAAKVQETPCTKPHYGKVRSVIDRAGRCPVSTEGHYSNDGEHLVCITTAE